MKPGKHFKLAKTYKRMMATITDPTARHEFKRIMIQSQLEGATVKKREKN